MSRTVTVFVGTVLIAAVRSLEAQDSPGILTSEEQRCERSAAQGLADFARAAAACFADCEEAMDDPASYECSSSHSGGLRDCLALASARAEVTALRDCAGNACPDCYAHGSCTDFVSQARFKREDAVAYRTAGVYCDDSGSADGLTARERACRTGLAAAAAKLSGSLDRCFGRCARDARRSGRPLEACRPAALDEPSADPALQRCVDTARARSERGCEKRCEDVPDCFGSTCRDFLATVVGDEGAAAAEAYCGDQPYCGDGWVTGDETCDPAASSTCPSFQFCNAACRCEPYAVCGDGVVSGAERCDQSATQNGCDPGEICRFCSSCTPSFCGDGVVGSGEGCDRLASPSGCAPGQACLECTTCASQSVPCDAAVVVSPAGGMLSGSTSGPSTTTSSRCGGAGPEAVYRWTPSVSGQATATTCNGSTSFPAVVYVRTGTCSTGEELDCDDGEYCAFGSGSGVSFRVNAGQTYWIFVDGLGGSSGSFRLDIEPSGVSSPSGT